MGCAKSTEREKEQPIRKHNKPAMMKDKTHEFKLDNMNRSDCIRPKFETEEQKRNSMANKKKVKDPSKRYRRVLIRIEHHKNDSQSSYSSLCSDWQTINSDDERLKSRSNLNNEANANINKENNSHENPFEVKEDKKDSDSKSNASKSKHSSKKHKHSIEDSDNS